MATESNSAAGTVAPAERCRSPRPWDWGRDGALAGALALVVFAAFASSIGNDHVYDDLGVIRDNPRLDDTWNLRLFFTAPNLSDADGNNGLYRPLFVWSLALLRAAFGAGPFGVHLANVVLNALLAAAVYALVRRLVDRRSVAFAAAALFGRGLSGQSPTPDVHDLDYITFTVPDGFRLDNFMLQSASVGGAFSFVGLQAGPIITIPADWTSVESPLLGWAHFGSADVGLDLLPAMATSPGSVGFSGPLGAGTYALWIMELNTSEPYTYSFGLGVTAVPAPAALALAAACSLLPRRRARGFRAN